MLVLPEDLPEFKKWAIQRLEQGNRTDADADILADYIIALLNADEPSQTIRVNLESNLKDFVHHGAAEFSDEIMCAVDQKQYKGAGSSTQSSDFPQLPPEDPERPQGILTQRDTRFRNRSPNPPPGRFASHASGSFQSRKRSYYDRDMPEQSSSRRSPVEERAKKFPRRGGRRSSRGRLQSTAYSPSMPAAYPAEIYQPGSNPSGHGGRTYYGNINKPNDASEFSGEGPAAALAYTQSINSSPYPPRPRCRDYDTKGFCTRGADCPYDHSDNLPSTNIVPNIEAITQHLMRNPSAFSPAALANVFGAMAKAVGESASRFPPPKSGSSFNDTNPSRRRKHRDRSGEDNSRGGRSAFSLVGAPQSRNNTTLVVENIPKENFVESDIREYFERFGEIAKITMPSTSSSNGKSIALLEFMDREAAEKAWHSPEAVFGNRFVKVFWSKAGDDVNSSSKNPHENHKRQHGKFNRNTSKQSAEDLESSRDEPAVDPMEVEQRIADAQRAHEDKLRKAAEAKEKLAEVEEKLKAQAEEKKKLLAMIAAKQKKKSGGSDDKEEPSSDGDGDINHNAESEDTMNADEELKARLKMLEAEAQSLGIDPSRPFPFPGYRGRGRGAFRARGRGSYRGVFGGGFRGGVAPGAVMRLDNRPKKIAVIGVKAGTPADEAVRRFLLNKFEKHDIEPHPEKEDSQVISFAERYMAELFIDGAPRELNPEVGKLELKWYTGPTVSPATPGSGAAPPSAPESITKESTDVGADSSRLDGTNNHLTDAESHTERDLDVADDDDRWMK